MTMQALSTVNCQEPQWVVQLQPQDDAMLRKLLALGIMPGSQVVVEQSFPSFIVRVGRARSALDRETVACIFVSPTAV